MSAKYSQNPAARLLHPRAAQSTGAAGGGDRHGLADFVRVLDNLRTVGEGAASSLESFGRNAAANAALMAKACGNLWTVFRATAFGRSLGLTPKPAAPGDGAEGFARTVGRFMGARVVAQAVNTGFEYHKNPLRDNFALERSQKTVNSVATTLATTGSPIAAAISGLTSWMMANIQRRNEIHSQNYQFQSRSADTRRSFEQNRGEWGFDQLLGMYSRGERLSMLIGRGAHIRGVVDEKSKAEDVRAAKAEMERYRVRAESPDATWDDRKKFAMAQIRLQNSEHEKVGGYYGAVVNVRSHLVDESRNVGRKTLAEYVGRPMISFGTPGMLGTIRDYAYEKRVADAGRLRRALGVKSDDEITYKALREYADGDDGDCGDGDIRKLAGRLAGRMEGERSTRLKKYDAELVKRVENGDFHYTDLASIRTALEAFKAEGQNTDDNAAYKRLKETYLAQEKRAEEIDFQQFRERNDPSQIMGQYLDASKAADSMSRQGFFIGGGPVDVEDVNRSILEQVRKIVPILEKVARQGVSTTSVPYAKTLFD